jgi:tetratricopeptide (TPR) repeat protein
MRTLLLVIPLCMFLNASFGQHDPEADSLKTLLISAKEDTSKVNILVSLSGHYSASDPGAAGAYASEALFLSDKLGSIPGIAKSHNSLGIVDYYQGNYTKALDHFSKATAGYEKTGNRKGKARSLGNSGLAQWQLGNYSLALKFYFR